MYLGIIIVIFIIIFLIKICLRNIVIEVSIFCLVLDLLVCVEYRKRFFFFLVVYFEVSSEYVISCNIID